MGGIHFPSTIWDVIRDSKRSVRDRSNHLYRSYRAPILQYIRRHGLTEADAEDLTQEVFVQTCNQRFLEKANPARGKLRSLLLCVTNRVLIKYWERTAAERPPSLGEEAAERLQENDPSPDDEFNRTWVKNLVAAALEELRRLQVSGRYPHYYDVLMLRDFERLSPSDIAEQLGMTYSQASNILHRARETLKRLVLDRIRETCANPTEFADEVRALGPFLSNP